MKELLPAPFIRVINALKHLPGVGEKTATRYAMHIFDEGDAFIGQLVKALSELAEKVTLCPVCNNLSEGGLCSICNDPQRDRKIICVVKDIRDLAAMEKSGTYNGLYHVTGGLISPLRGIMPKDLFLDTIRHRCMQDPGIEEVIVTLDATVEGDTTAMYIKEILKDLDVRVSRPAMGIPTGTDIGYLDGLTLSRALRDRKNI